MSASDNDSQIDYFLGVEGEQTGPFSELDLLAQIRNGTVSPEALIWWDGQSDWIRISDIPKFNQNFSTAEPSPINQEDSVDKLEEELEEESQLHLAWKATFAMPKEELRPVYNSEQSYFKNKKPIPVRVAVGVIAVGLIGFGVLWTLLPSTSDSSKNGKKRATTKEDLQQKRKQALAQASSQLFLEPAASIKTLNNLIDQNSKDAEAKEAAEILLNYYRQNKQIEPASDLLVKFGRFSEALKLLSSDPTLVQKTEMVLFTAFQKSSGKDSANFLIKDIELLIKPLEQFPLAKERIDLFEKTFPGLTHPFSYYGLPSDQKIMNIFTRLSSTFVDNLTGHISDEFPQIHLASRPLVEIKRNSTGNLRIVGRYSGDLLLRNDRMKGMFFLYWLVNDQWLLVDTNLTSDRQRFAAITRKKYESSVSTPNEMLAFLESQFRRMYPSQRLHEAISPNSPSNTSILSD